MPQYNAISRTNHIGILVDTVGHNACVACRFHKHDRLLFVRTFQSIIKSEVRTRRNRNAFLSLIRLQGCYYVSKDLDSVSRYWKNFYVTPMATNLQMIICVAPSGTPYIRLDLNEHPVCFPGTDKYYVSWKQARKYFNDILDSATFVPVGK